MPNVPSGSQAQVVPNNPYIPGFADDTFSMMDYFLEVARITQSGGKIVINGTAGDRYVTNTSTRVQLDVLGLEIQYQGALLPQFQGAKCLRADGFPFTAPLQFIVFVKK